MKKGISLVKKQRLRQFFQLSTWVWLLLLGIVSTGGLIWASAHQSMQTSMQLHILSQLSMYTQRLSKAAIYSLQGQSQAFDQLDESREVFGRGLYLLMEGGKDETGHHYSPPSESDRQQIQQLQRIWGTTHQAIFSIQSKKKELIALHQMKSQMDASLPALLQLRQRLLAQKEGMPWQKTQLEITSTLLIDTIQLYSALLASDDPVSREENKQSQLNRQFKNYAGWVATLLPSDKNKANAIEKVPSDTAQSIALLETYSQLLTEFVDLYPHYMTLKQEDKNIQLQAEALKNGLMDAIDQKESQLAARSWAFWPIQIAILFSMACVMGIVRERLSVSHQHTAEAELRRKEAEEQRRLAQYQEEKAIALHEQNQQALLAFTQELERLSEGDLTVHLKASDDVIGAIAHMMNQSVHAIRGLVRKTIEMAELVTVTTASLGVNTTAVVEVSRRQSVAIRETGTDIQEIASQMAQISASADASVDVAKNSVIAAERGAKAVGDSVQGMYDIRDHIKETAQRIKRLGESSQEIGEVTDLIADIAEQTNVLSMNAFIQAAAAGEAGKGFTVVAEEIQRLAERSNDATKQISALIKTIQVDTHDAIAAMERSTVGVVEGSKLVDAAGAALSDIRQVSNQLADLIRHFSSATQSQATLIRRVASTMQNMLELNIRIEEGRERVGDNYQQLEGVAQQLKSSVSRFRISP